MLLALLLAAVEPGTGLDLPPDSDPTGRLIVAAVALIGAVSPILLAKIQAKKNASNTPTPLPGDSPTPRLDVGEGMAQRLFKELEDRRIEDAARYEARLAAAEAKSEDLRKQVQSLIEERATFRAQVESFRAENAELRAENVEVRAELRALRGRLNG